MRLPKLKKGRVGLLAGIAYLLTGISVVPGQEPYSIRVEPRQVLIPTFVFDKARLDDSSPARPCTPSDNASKVGRETTPQVFCSNWEVSGLTERDFHVFEDGQEQKVQRVSPARASGINVHDNIAEHDEYSNTPRGRWSTSDRWPQMGFLETATIDYYYLIGYVPPPSAEGSCHKIKVKVDRHNSLVYARSSYCNTRHAPSDPLEGTPFGKQMDEELYSTKPGKIDLSLQTAFFYQTEDQIRVHVALEFPWNSLNRKWDDGNFSATIGVLGAITRSDGTTVGRFSDFACCPGQLAFVQSDHPRSSYPKFDIVFLPARYETQINLPPGEYSLRLVLSDGSKFGRAGTSLRLDRHDGQQLTISTIALCKRFRDAVAAAKDAAAVNLSPEFVPLVSNGMEFTSAGDTRFKKGERLFAYFEVYAPLAGRTPTNVQTRLRVTALKDGEVKVDTGLRSSGASIRTDHSVITIADEIAVSKLSQGSYRLEVQASDSAGDRTTWRSADFTVE